MAKKRFNTRFATTLAAVVAGIGAVSVGGYFVLKPKESPARFEALAESSSQARDFVRAYAYYAKAIKLTTSPTAEQFVKLADLAKYAGAQDPALQLKDREALQRGLEVDPKYAPAIKRLLDIEWELARIDPKPASFSRVRELAEKAVSADPTDKRAAALIPTSTVQGWLLNVEADPTRLEADMQAMNQILDANPSDHETAFVLARAYMKKASEALKVGRQRESQQAYDAAGAIFDKALKADDQSVLLRIRAILVYRDLGRFDRANAKKYDKRLTETIERARQLARPDQPGYVEINLEAAAYAAAKSEVGSREAADKIYKELRDAQPRNQQVRLAYADFLQRDPLTRAQAVELLSLPVERGDAINTSLASEQTRQLEVRTRMSLQAIRLDMLATTLDAKEREPLMAVLATDVAKLQQEFPELAQPMVLRGRLEMLQSRHVEASRTFGIAKQLLERRPDRLTGEYYDLLMRLADAYAQSQQTGPAKDLLRQVLSEPATRTFLPARFMLIQILAKDGDDEAVRREFNIAKQIHESGESLSGNKDKDAQMIRALQVAIDKMDNRPDLAAQNLASQPEATKAERMRKGQQAMQVQLYSEAIRLLELAYTEDEKDAVVAEMFVQALAADGKVDQANTVADRAIEVSPDNLRLKLLKARLNKVDPSELMKIMEESARGEKDEFTREMQLYELSVVQQKADQALVHLNSAAKLKPDDKRVLDQLFQQALLAKRYDDAEQMLPKLTAINVDQAGGNLFRFKLAQVRGQNEEALRLAQQLTQEMSGFGQSWLALGQAYMALGNWEQANNAFRQALERQATNIDAMRGSIDANYRMNRPAEANRVLTDALKRFPRDPQFQEMRLDYELSFGDYASAVARREAQAQGREADPAMQGALGNAYLKAAASSSRAGDGKKAQEYARKGGEAYARLLALVPDQWQAMPALARAALQSEDPRWAEEVLKKTADSAALAARPEPMFVLADYYLALGQAETAEKSVREAVRRGGTTVPARRAAADIFVRLNKVDEAVSMLDGADGAKDNRELQQQRAEILIRAGRYELAETAIRALLKNAPTDSNLQNLLSVTLFESRRFDDTLKQVQQTLAQNPQDPTALYYRALVGLETGRDLSGAVRDLQTIRTLGPLPIDKRLKLVQAYLAIGDSTGAIRELRELAQLAPGNKQVRIMLAEQLMRSQPPQVSETQKVIDEGLAVRETANDPDLLMLKARVLLATGDAKTAVDFAGKAVNAGQGSAALFRTYLDVLLAANQAQQVLALTDPIVAKPEPKPFWLLVSRGTAKRILKDREGALVEFTNAIEAAVAQKDENSAAQAVGSMAQQLGADDAIKSISNRLTGPQGGQYRLITAMLHQTQGRLKLALDILEPALTDLKTYSEVDQARILKAVGTLLVSPGPQENPVRATDIYLELLKLTPNDVLVLNNVAFLLSEKLTPPRNSEALIYSSRAVKVLQDAGSVEPLIFDTHGWLLVLNGRVPEGINILSEAISRKSFMEGHYHLGMAYLQSGPRFAAAAVDQLQQAQRLGDDKNADASYRPKINEALKQAIDAMAKQQSQAPGGGN